MNSARSSLADFPYKKVLITPSGDMNPPSPVIQHKDPPPPAPIPTTSPPCSQPLIPWLMGQSTELVSAPKNAAAGTQLTPMEFSLADMRRSSMRSGGSLYQAFSFSTTTRTNAAFNNTYSVSEFMHNFSVNPKDPWTLDGVTIVETDSDIEEDMSSLSSDQDSDENIATEETDKSMASEEFEKDVINLQLETDNLIPAKQLYKSIDQEKTYSQTDALSLIQRVGRGYLCRRHENFLFMVRVSKEEITLMHRVVKGFPDPP
ncbi:hypothetical protein ADEAN_000171800 [Angomonas deanei]|uniref:Uncharacterized protein n=1 Tax=Angomonas deanei TaxID=59799 RepID=A0A7G2C655_9TRYP|nr:hypothetical protein ADEAN_000171800 [Angomonas deanei]